MLTQNLRKRDLTIRSQHLLIAHAAHFLVRYNYAKPEKLRISRVGGFRQGFSSFSKPRNRAAKQLYRTLAETAVPLAASFPSSIWFRLPGSSPRLAPHAPPFEA